MSRLTPAQVSEIADAFKAEYMVRPTWIAAQSVGSGLHSTVWNGFWSEPTRCSAWSTLSPHWVAGKFQYIGSVICEIVADDWRESKYKVPPLQRPTKREAL